MVGAKTRVPVCINEIESPGYLTHCHGHDFWLAVGKTIKSKQIMIDTLDASFELKKYQILCGLKIIEKNQILFKKERSFQKVERKRQENLVTELRAQMVGLSEGQSCESF